MEQYISRPGGLSSVSTHVQRFDHLANRLETHVEAPRVVLVIDAAHELNKSLPDAGWSQLSELRRSLGQLRYRNLFSLFLSAAHLDQSTPPRLFDMSKGTDLLRNASFSAMDYDVFAEPVGDGRLFLSDLVKTDHIVTFGRAL
jgi:hypothetical protein